MAPVVPPQSRPVAGWLDIWLVSAVAALLLALVLAGPFSAYFS